MTKLVVDSSAWMEYLTGSAKGARARKLIDDPSNNIYVSALALAEMTSKIIREGKSAHAALDIVKSNSRIVPADGETAIRAGEIHAETRKKIPKFGMGDAFAVAAAEKTGAAILTADNDFRLVRNAIII